VYPTLRSAAPPLLALLLLILPLCGQAPLASEMNPGRYANMAESMVDMMDAFADAYGKRRFGGTSGSNSGSGSGWGASPWDASSWSGMPSPTPWSAMTTPWSGMPGLSPWPQIPGMGSAPSWSNITPGLPNLFPPLPSMPRPPAPAATPFQGIWLGQSGEVFVVRDGAFRIYIDPDTFREGRLKLQDDRLVMLDPQSGNTVEYDYIFEEDHLALRDPWGGMLLYRLLLRNPY